MTNRVAQQEKVTPVTFMSYNPTGLNCLAKCRFSNKICSDYQVDFLTIQEHFKFTSTTNQYFKKQFPEYFSYVIPGHRSPGQDSGRAKAGLAQLSSKYLKINKKRVPTKSYRVQAQVLQFPTTRVLWLNTYSPTDPQLVGHYDDRDLQELLSEVEEILTNELFDDVIWGSDLNWDPSRATYFSRTMKNFLDRLGLVSVWSQYPVDFTHTHTDKKSTSVLDHFVLSPRLLPLLEGCGTVDRGDNLSRHCPIWIKINLGSLPERKPTPTWIPRKPCWSKATQTDCDSYTADLQSRLLDQAVPDSIWCSDPHCQDPSHTSDRDRFVVDLLESLVQSCYTTLPLYGGKWVGGANARKGMPVPGWLENVEPYREESYYWGNVWKKERRPSTGWLHDLYIKKRAQYHYALRRAQAARDRYCAEGLLAAALQGDTALLKEMKIIKKGGGGPPELPDTVGGANGDEEIVEKFKQIYSTLYNSASTKEGVYILSERIKGLVSPYSVNEVAKVTGDKVKMAASRMKSRKADVSGWYTSDSLLNAPNILFEQLAIVFRSWLTHGTITPCLLACSFLPLLKSSLKDPCDPGSYRAIAGSSLVLKLFENVVLLVWGDLISSDSLQFGFKAQTSTTHCTWMVNEVVQHLLRSGTNPIVTVLDCTKAFDLCKFSTLFSRLLDSGVPPIVVRCMIFMYEEQVAWVSWGRVKSDSFSISNGTRQGSVMSPILWAIYCDPLIKRLRKLGLGAHIAGLYMGVACFADDVILIAPCYQAMQIMLQEVEAFAQEHNVQFSTDPVPQKSKSKCIYMVGNRKNQVKPPELRLCGRTLPWVERATHLGHELDQSGQMEYDAATKRAQFIAKSLEIRTLFQWASPVEVMTALKIYSSSFYGAMLWDLAGEKARQVYNAWNVAIKLTWGCPRATRTFLLQNVLSNGLPSARADILGRYPKFFQGLRSSASYEVRVLANLTARDLRTTTGKNLRAVRVASGLDPWTDSYAKIKDAIIRNEQVEVAAEDQWRIPYLKKLLVLMQDLKAMAMDEAQEELKELIDSLVL